MSGTVVPMPQRGRAAVLIGCRVTGRSEYFRDTVTGEYSEQLPMLGRDALRLQRALCPPIRQPSDWQLVSDIVTKWFQR